MREDLGIATLIDLHDQIIDQGDGYWVKIEAWVVPVSKDIPHGVRYTLTLHEPYGKRILGYDNAHAVKPPKKFKYAGTRLPYDHKHRHVSDKGVPYEFKDAHQLLSDFLWKSIVYSRRPGSHENNRCWNHAARENSRADAVHRAW